MIKITPAMARILIVDDNAVFRRMLREVLEGAGYEVVEAPDGGVALQMHLEQRCDIVITDLLMPVKEGLETIREFRSTDSKVKIIAMSGGGLMLPGTNLAIAEKLGADLTLTKPFLQQEVLDVVLRVLKETN